MAVTNTADALADALTSITKRYYVPKLNDNISTSNALLMRVKKDTCPGGSDIRVPLHYAFINGAQWYAGDQTLNTNYNEKKIAAIYNWKQLDIPVVIVESDRLKNAGSEKVLDHLDTEMTIAQATAKNKFGTGMYSNGTTDPLSIAGTRAIISTSATVGGISQTTYSWWAAQLDSTTTNVSLGTMQTMYENCMEDDDKPDLITAYPGAFNRFWSLLQPQQRYQNATLGAAGFENLRFNQADVVVDSYCPSGYMNFINTKHLILKSHNERNFPGKMDPFIKPVNQDARVAHLLWMGALVSDENRKLGAFTALTD
jgi:hypothetical protein